MVFDVIAHRANQEAFLYLGHFMWPKKWSLCGGGLLKGAKIYVCYDCCWDMTKWSLKTSGLLIQVVTRIGFTVQ